MFAYAINIALRLKQCLAGDSMWISRYVVELVIFSFLGWIWESVYCTICNGRWESRGFLFGPVCPIYGVGALGGFAFLDILKLNGQPVPAWWVIFLIGFFGSAVLEFCTSLALEKLFHACWWDYSKMPLNIQGRICLPASLGFAAAGLLVAYVLYPFCNQVFSLIPGEYVEAAALLFAVMMASDMTMTVISLTDVLNKVLQIDENIHEHISERVDVLYRSMNRMNKSVVARIKEVRLAKPDQSQLFRKLIEKIKK